VDTTFLLGAGINRSVSGPDGLMPPLARDFFRQALRHPRLAAEYSQIPLSPLFNFIQKYWHLDRSQLLTADFDLEDCYTFIELQRREAYFRGDSDGLAQASRIQHLLTGLLLDYLSECERWHYNASTFREFGRLIYRTHARVLTFNYDTLLESAIENASLPNQDAVDALTRREVSVAQKRAGSSATLKQQGLSEEEIFDQTCDDDEISDEHISFSFHQWNPFLAYKVRFDEVALRTPGNLRIVPGTRYYEHPGNAVEHAPFLKLHGSLGWFVHSGYRVDGVRLSGESAASEGKTVLRRPLSRFNLPEIDYAEGEVLLPLIITPVLNKPYDEHPVFRTIWAEARNELKRCKKLVIGGYSFPPTDFHVRRLFREVFCDRGPEDLCIINPDTSVVRIAKELCNYKGPVLVCGDLVEFMQEGV
jgi:hypothetical protein